MTDTSYLQYLTEKIHTVILATVDEKGHPVTCAIDIMLWDRDGLYFLTAKGKSLYRRLTACPHISLTGIQGEDTLSSITLTIRGEVEEIGSGKLGEIFSANPYMAEIYPSEESRKALTVFHLYRGSGEFFDLSRRPIFRESFTFGGEKIHREGYYITDKCTACGKCLSVCPQECITIDNGRAVISQKNCLHCGRCMEVCPSKAVERRNL